MQKTYKDVKIRLGLPANKTLRKRAIDEGYDSFSEYLRDIIGKATGVDMSDGISTWGGKGRKEKSEPEPPVMFQAEHRHK